MPPALMPHLLIAFASCSGEPWIEAMQAQTGEKLKNLGKLLQGMKLDEINKGRADSLSTPHERVLAAACGLEATTDGLLPWAALEAITQFGAVAIEKAWAFVTPCHWAMGREQAIMSDPALLGLSEQESKTLLAAMQPYFETEGITLHYLSAGRWLADGECLRALPTASLDRVLGRNVDLWLPGSSRANECANDRRVGAALRRLQNEMQMLLYTHAVNDDRSAQRAMPVNSFWLSGSGALRKAPQVQPTGLAIPRGLAEAAFNHDWAAYGKAWDAIDAAEVAHFLALQKGGTAVRLSLCGESHAQTFTSSAAGIIARISRAFRPQRPMDLLNQL